MQRLFRINVNGTDYDVAVQELTDVNSQIMPKYSATAPVLAASTVPIASVASAAPAVRAPAGSGDQCAQMSGVVAGILVKPGQKVIEGDRILELEAMKMKVPVIASRSGTVSHILVNVGDGVEKGQALVSLA
jgi:glutaconyl-CoA/methylmalonyl-CoA decarboxylase subunit gamma